MGGLIAAVFVPIAGCVLQETPIPSACIQAEPTIGYAPLAIVFDASYTKVPAGAEGVYVFQWEFADGAEGEGRTAVRTYTEPGTYTVAVLMFKDGVDLVDIATRVVTVLPTK